MSTPLQVPVPSSDGRRQCGVRNKTGLRAALAGEALMQRAVARSRVSIANRDFFWRTVWAGQAGRLADTGRQADRQADR